MSTRARSRYTGTHVFRIMESRGQKAVWLASQLGCHPTFLSKIERGQRSIPQWFVDGCVRVFGLPEESLFFVDDGLSGPSFVPDDTRNAVQP